MFDDWSPTPPRFLRRWAAQGVKRDGATATTIFDLLHDRAHIAVYPATVDTFAVLIDRAAMEVLVDTMESRATCTVPARHAVYGARRLGLRPYDLPLAHRWSDRPADVSPHGGPIELFVILPEAEVNIVYGWNRLSTFRIILHEVMDTLAEQN